MGCTIWSKPTLGPYGVKVFEHDIGRACIVQITGSETLIPYSSPGEEYTAPYLDIYPASQEWDYDYETKVTHTRKIRNLQVPSANNDIEVLFK